MQNKEEQLMKRIEAAVMPGELEIIHTDKTINVKLFEYRIPGHSSGRAGGKSHQELNHNIHENDFDDLMNNTAGVVTIDPGR